MIKIKELGAIKSPKNRSTYALYECPVCKKEFIARNGDVSSGKSTKCKSCSMKKAKTKHGDCKTRLYIIWSDMKARCNNANHKNYNDYGGRGINVCDEWIIYENFKDWALNNRYEDCLTIDRENNNGNYNPTNCRWATRKQQVSNRRISYV